MKDGMHISKTLKNVISVSVLTTLFSIKIVMVKFVSSFLRNPINKRLLSIK